MTERLYFRDSFLTDFEAVVTEVQELSRAQGRSLWRLALDRSAFYPTSGGQPHDSGRLIAVARSGAGLIAEISDVTEDEQGEIWHHTEKPLLAGTRVRGAIDMERRLDHLQQHSGQHLLSAAFFRVAGAPTVSFHLGEAVSTIDLATGALGEETMHEVERLVNRIIAEDRLVSVRVISRAQAEEWLASGWLRKLPARTGELRVIQIEGGEIAGGAGDEAACLDRNACGGTHVRSTGQIGGLQMRGIEKVREGLRVEFVCGLRAIRAAREDFETLAGAARHLSVGSREVPEAVLRIQTESKQRARRTEKQTAELARYHAGELLREIPMEHGVRRVKLQFSAEETDGVAYGKLLASQVTAQGERTVAVFAWRPAEENEAATILFARSADLALDCGALLRETLGAHGGRGGGSKDMAQGTVPADRVDAVMDALAASVGGELG